MGALIIKGAVTAIVVAAIISPIICLTGLMMAKAAPGRKPGYFNIGYRPEYDTKFYRAHLVGVVERIGNVMLYIVEIHPEDATKARAWTVRKAELCGRQLLKKGKFYRYAFKEELYG